MILLSLSKGECTVSECPCLSSAAECSKNSGPLLSLPQSLPTPTPTLTGQNPQYGRRLQSSELCTLLLWTDLMYSVCQSLMCIRLVGTIIGNITRYRKALRKEIYLALRWSCISTTIDTREGIVIKKRQLQNRYPIMGEAHHDFLWHVHSEIWARI